jgi:exosortase
MNGRWRRISILALLGIGFALMYRSTIAALVAEWLSSPEASYGLVLAATAVAVAVRRWPAFLSQSTAEGRGLAGLGLALFGAFLFTIGQLGADLFLTRVSLVVLLAGAVWALCGARATRAVAAPLVFLLIAIPLPALVVNEVTLPLQLAASRVAEFVLGASGIPVYRDGNLLALPSGTLQVAEACSGLRSAVSLGGVGVLLAWATEPTLARRVLLVVLTLPIAVVMNGLRVAATGIYLEAAGRAPGGDLHEFMGWITFLVAVAALIGLQRLTLGRIHSRGAPAPVALAGETA